MPCLRQMSEIVSPLARSRSASRSDRATSSAFLRLLMGPSRPYSTRRLPFRLDQFSGGSPNLPLFGRACLWFLLIFVLNGLINMVEAVFFTTIPLTQLA